LDWKEDARGVIYIVSLPDTQLRYFCVKTLSQPLRQLATNLFGSRDGDAVTLCSWEVNSSLWKVPTTTFELQPYVRDYGRSKHR